MVMGTSHKSDHAASFRGYPNVNTVVGCNSGWIARTVKTGTESGSASGRAGRSLLLTTKFAIIVGDQHEPKGDRSRFFCPRDR